MNYQIEENDTILDIKNDNVVITINSLLQLINIPDEEFFNYIFYDEVKGFPPTSGIRKYHIRRK